MESVFPLPLEDALPDWDRIKGRRFPDAPKVYMQRREPSLGDHFRELEREFAGESHLDFVHAALTVLIRREIQSDLAYDHFESLWNAQSDHLLKRLSARWLVSACDTIMVRSRHDSERALAAAGSLFFNTIKLYETERFHSECVFNPKGNRAAPVPLFDGMTTFSIGRGELISAQRQRARALVHPSSIAGRILLELFNRADENDTVFRRFAAMHELDDTRW